MSALSGLVVGNIQRIYESVNIYNAVFLYDVWTDELEEMMELLQDTGFPVAKWEPGTTYLYISRLLMVKTGHLAHLLADEDERETFSLVMTVDDAIFHECLRMDACSTMMIVRV
jgi:hypothetical protein